MDMGKGGGVLDAIERRRSQRAPQPTVGQDQSHQ